LILVLVVVTGPGFRLHQRLPRHGQRDGEIDRHRGAQAQGCRGHIGCGELVGAFLSISVAVTVTNAVVKTLATAKPATGASRAVPAHLVHQDHLLAIVFAGRGVGTWRPTDTRSRTAPPNSA